MLARQSHEMIDRQWCWAEFEERSGVGRNRTVVDAVFPLHQSNGDHQRDTKAPCGYDSRKQARQVETRFFLEPVTSAGPGANEWRGRTCKRDTQDAPLHWARTCNTCGSHAFAAAATSAWNSRYIAQHPFIVIIGHLQITPEDWAVQPSYCVTFSATVTVLCIVPWPWSKCLLTPR